MCQRGNCLFSNLKIYKVYKLIAFLKTLQRLKQDWQKSGTRQTDGKKLGLIWRNRKKICKIINAYLYLPFFLLIILCQQLTLSQSENLKDNSDMKRISSEFYRWVRSWRWCQRPRRGWWSWGYPWTPCCGGSRPTLWGRPTSYTVLLRYRVFILHIVWLRNEKPSQSKKLTRGPPLPPVSSALSFTGGVHIGARELHVLKLI
jgi:hypothetical protein